jgi:hypothetical protein
LDGCRGKKADEFIALANVVLNDSWIAFCLLGCWFRGQEREHQLVVLGWIVEGRLALHT